MKAGLDLYKFPNGGCSIKSRLNGLINWSRINSLWYIPAGMCCCCNEVATAVDSHIIFQRFGMRCCTSPRQADLLVITGPITVKIRNWIQELYNQMANPKYVIAMGDCAVSGGPYSQYEYQIVRGAGLIFPVDIYIPGCPPCYEDILKGLTELKSKIARDKPLKKSKNDTTVDL